MNTAVSALTFLLCLSACTPITEGGPGTASASGAKPLIGRCHMGGCSWFRIIGQRVLREEGGERLVRANIAEGGSDHGNSGYPENPRNVDIGWQPPTDDYYFLCSSSRPLAIFRKENGGTGYDGLKLDFVNGPFGATEAVSSQYTAVCHPGEDMNAEGFATRHGYGPADIENPAVDLATPEAVFDLRR
jgi:hypothetical protein